MQTVDQAPPPPKKKKKKKKKKTNGYGERVLFKQV